MKKSIISASFIIASIFAFSAKAQVPQELLDQTADYTTIQTPADTCTCTATEKSEQCKKAKKNKKGRRDEARREHRHGPDFFKGITLTAEQQTAIDALRPDKQDKGRKERDYGRELTKEEIEGLRAGRQAERELQFEEYKVAVKQILTPEQYTIFEQNVNNFVTERANGPDKGEMRQGDKHKARYNGKGDMRRGDRKDGKNGKDRKGDKDNRNNCETTTAQN